MAPKPRPRFEMVDVPHRFVDLAQRRTEFLFQVITYGNQSMKNVLASAYLQGMGDAADAIENRDQKAKGWLPPHFHC